MTYKEAISHAAEALSNISDSAFLDAQLLVCHACDTSQTLIITHPEYILSKQEYSKFQKILSRRCQGEPLAYITGTKEFWSLDFLVNEHVLIPRPETELLVETTLDLISKIQTPRVLDLGTGSGAIAISIAKECSRCLIYATDLSRPALEVAKKNAEIHKVDVTFTQSDWYKKLNSEKFDVIVCNPPYVAADDRNLDYAVAKFEPDTAVISNHDGLRDIEIIISHAQQYLNISGYLLIEHGFEQKLKVQNLFEQYEFNNVFTLKDLTGLDRATCGNA